MSTNLSPVGGAAAQFLDNNGNPLSGGKIYTYEAGTTTPEPTYTTIIGDVPHSNPIVLDSAGRVPAGQIWVNASQDYKFVLTTSADVTIATYDDLTGINGTGLATNAVNVAYDPPGLGAVQTNVQAKLRETVSVIDYGADSTGVSNSSAAFLAAVTENPGADVLVPAGTYMLTSTIAINTTGLGDTSVTRFVGEGMYQTIIDNRTGGPAFSVTSGTAAEFAYGFGLSHLSITNPSTTANTIGVRIDGCRFVTLDNVRIDGMSSHGIYGLSSVGDFTDTSSVEIRQCQIENCGGYGVYAAATGNAIQYSWNLYECRIGLNTSGGVLWESMINASMAYCGIYYNSGFGVRITSGSGAPLPKQIHIDHCEFDTNDGVQIDLVNTYGALITTPYLIANKDLAQAYTKGIVVGASCNSTVIEQAAPRWDPSLSGLVGMEFALGSTDNVARDTIYAGFSSLVGTMYVDHSNGELTIDDKANRIRSEQGSWTVQFKDQSGHTSPTTVTGYYTVNGSLVTAAFRNLDAIDTSGFVGTDNAQVSLPFQCAIVDTDFVGSSVMTSVTGIPFPVTGNSNTNAYFVKGGGTTVLVSDFTSGVSNIDVFTLSYQRA